MTGVLVVPSLKRVYGSVTKNHEVAVVDTETLAIVKRIPDGKFPDGLAFSPETKKLYVSDESGGVATVIDATTNEKLRAIPLGGEAGNTQYDPTSHLIYVAVQTRNQLVAIDPRTDKITARYDLKRASTLTASISMPLAAAPTSPARETTSSSFSISTLIRRKMSFLLAAARTSSLSTANSTCSMSPANPAACPFSKPTMAS
jgi:hypothetical protein